MLSDVQGCWRALGASFGKSITFKTTLKGNNMLMKNGLGDLWMPCLCFLGLLASLGFGLHKVITQQQLQHVLVIGEPDAIQHDQDFLIPRTQSLDFLQT